MSTIGLEPTTVAQASALMAGSLGLRYPEDRLEILEAVNDFRDILYNSYADLKLFNNVMHCIQVVKFPERCGYACCEGNTFQGFVLPRDVVSIETAWEYGQPLKVRSQWRESHYGIDTEGLPRIAVTHMPDQVCTERPLTKVIPLRVFAEAEEDAGLEVHLEVVDDTGKRMTFKYELEGDGWATIQRPVQQIISVSLPPGRKGNITLAQEDDEILSVYAPGELAPAYSMFRVAQTCGQGVILLQGVKRFLPVYCDHDIVEVGSRSVLKAAASFLKFKENTTDPKALNRATYDKTEMGQYLVGLHARTVGGARQDNPPVIGRKLNNSTVMPGYS